MCGVSASVCAISVQANLLLPRGSSVSPVTIPPPWDVRKTNGRQGNHQVELLPFGVKQSKLVVSWDAMEIPGREKLRRMI